MQISMRAEIHFHQSDKASVFLESGTPADEERYGEAALFAFYAARQLVNLGAGEAQQGLAHILRSLDADDELTDFLVGFDHDRNPDAPALVDYQGARGRKGFTAALELTDARLDFNSKPWGFGLLGRGVNYYSPNSACLLLRHLALRRAGDGEYLDALGATAGMLAVLFFEGRLTLRTQAEAAAMACGFGACDLAPDDE